MKRIIALVMLLALTLICVSCGGDPALKEAAGKYEGEYAKMVGSEENEEKEAFSIELNANGKGKFNRDGESYDVTWSLDGEKITLQETFLFISLDYTGTLSGGKLTLYNGDPEDDFTMMYVFNKK